MIDILIGLIFEIIYFHSKIMPNFFQASIVISHNTIITLQYVDLLKKILLLILNTPGKSLKNQAHINGN